MYILLKLLLSMAYILNCYDNPTSKKESDSSPLTNT